MTEVDATARTGASDQAWRQMMVNYRRVHQIGPFESVPIANIEKWALEQANCNSQITMQRILAGGTAYIRPRHRPG